MSDIELLADLLRASLPGLELRLDLPAEPEEAAWLDAEQNGRFVSVEWRPRRGFGVSLVDTSRLPQEGLFEGPDKVLTDPVSARDHIVGLFDHRAEPQAWRRVRASTG